MSNNLNQAVALLNDVLALSRTTTSSVDQARLDAVVDAVAPLALEDAERFTEALLADVAAARFAVARGQAAADRNFIAEEERAEQEVVQEEEDQKNRDERHAAGVS